MKRFIVPAVALAAGVGGCGGAETQTLQLMGGNSALRP